MTPASSSSTIPRARTNCGRSGRPGSARARTCPGEPDTFEGWEDAAVPPDRLGDYLRDLQRLYDEFGYSSDFSPSLYGHFGQGCVHTRIPFDLYSSEGVAHYRRFMERAADLVVSYGGSLSGEHGDGQSRGELLVRMFGEELVGAFGELKAIFDPGHRMNPARSSHPARSMRTSGSVRDWAPATPQDLFFSYPPRWRVVRPGRQPMRRHREMSPARTRTGR